MTFIKNVGKYTDGEDGVDFGVTVVVPTSVDVGADFTINLRGSPTPGMTPTVTVLDDILPIVGDVALIGDNKDKAQFIRVVNAEMGIIRFSANVGFGTLSESERTLTLKYRTPASDVTVLAAVAGEGSAMQLELPEAPDSKEGEYTGLFIVQDKVTIDLNDIRQEQQPVPRRLKANKKYEQTIEIPAGGSTTFTLSNVPLAESPADQDANDVLETNDMDISYTVPSTEQDPSAAFDGAIKDTGVVTLTQRLPEGTTVTVTYYAGETFTVTLDHAVVQGVYTTTALVAGATDTGSDIGDTVVLADGTVTDADDNAIDDTLVFVAAPGPMTATLLYKAISFDPVSGDLKLAVRQDTGEGSYIGVSYKGSTTAKLDGRLIGSGDGSVDDNAATTTAVLADVGNIPTSPDMTHFRVIYPITGDGTTQNTGVVVRGRTIETGDAGEVTKVTLILSAEAGFDLSRGSNVYVVYDTDTSNDAWGMWDIPAPKGYNPQGSLSGGKCETDDGGDLVVLEDGSPIYCPIVEASAGGSVSVTYRDESPSGTVRETISVDGEHPVFDEASPAQGTVVSDEDFDITIQISDEAGEVDTSTVRLFVLTSTDPDDVPSASDLAYDDSPDKTDAIRFTDNDLETSSDASGHTITANLEDLLRHKDLGADLDVEGGKENYVWWWVQATDKSGNQGVSDAVTDDKDKDETKGTQPYTVRIDLKSPQLAEEGSRTGDYWDPDAATGDDKQYLGVIKNNKRDSIRVVFDEAIDGDSVAPSDFTVSMGTDNLTVVDALHYEAGSKTPPEHKGSNDIARSVFLVLSTDLDSDATPKVTLAGPVSDKAGRSVSKDNVTVADGIAPGVEVEVSHPVSSGDGFTITVTTDEDISRGAPRLELYIAPSTGDGTRQKLAADDKDRKLEKGDPEPAVLWTGRVGTANRVGRDNEWVFSPRFDDDDSQRYSVVVTDADDRSGNKGMKDVKDPDGKGAITFEIDKNMDEPTAVEPEGGAKVSEREPFYITITWKDEGSEYPKDSQKTVTLTKAVLESTLADDSEDERNLLAEAITLDEGRSGERTLEGEDLSSTRNDIKFTITIPDIGIGKHTLTYNAMDSQGNTLESDATLEFEVVAQPKFTLSLNPGMNLVSIPNTPADTDINTVLGEYEDIDLVITLSEGVWLTATRDADTGMFEATGTATDLTTIDAKHAYYIRTTAPVTVEVDIPATGILRDIPSVSAKGGQWNLIPVISILPIGTNKGEIQAGDELDADEYFGSGLRIFTVDDGRTVSVSTGKPTVDKDDEDAKKGPEVYSNDGDASTGAEFGMGYWVFYDFDHTILP